MSHVRRFVSAGLMVCAVAASATAQPGAIGPQASDRSACLVARRAQMLAAQVIEDVVERTQRLQALPDCGPAPEVIPATLTLTPWDEVSHINGQLVKVGDRNAYLKASPKRVIIATNPIGFLVGFYGLSVSVAVTNHVAVRGNVEHFDYEFFGHTTGHELALSAPIYFRRTFSGPFFEPGFLYQETMETGWDLWGDGDNTPVAHTWAGPEMLFGWHWTFDSGFNVAAALGATQQLASRMNADPYASNEPRMTGYLRIGMAF